MTTPSNKLGTIVRDNNGKLRTFRLRISRPIPCWQKSGFYRHFFPYIESRPSTAVVGVTVTKL